MKVQLTYHNRLKCVIVYYAVAFLFIKSVYELQLIYSDNYGKDITYS